MNMQHLSRGKTEATCFLFLFTLSSPPFLPLLFLLLLLRLLFPLSTPDRAENWTTTGEGKKEQMNRSRMESRCSSSWFTAVEFNPCRQITIVISNYNSLTGRTVTVRAGVDVHVENFKPRPPIFSPLSLPFSFLSSSLPTSNLSLSLSLSFFCLSHSRFAVSFARKTNHHGSHRPCVESIRRYYTCGWTACLLRIVRIVRIVSCVRWNERVFNKNRYWSFNWTNI